jgi:hypothetical protein
MPRKETFVMGLVPLQKSTEDGSEKVCFLFLLTLIS